MKNIKRAGRTMVYRYNDISTKKYSTGLKIKLTTLTIEYKNSTASEDPVIDIIIEMHK
jgi:ribosomal protein S17E